MSTEATPPHNLPQKAAQPPTDIKAEPNVVESVVEPAPEAATMAGLKAELKAQSQQIAEPAVVTKPKPVQPPKSKPNSSAGLCANCSTELDGPFCAKCGQPEKSMIRFFGSVVMHFLDDVFGFDSRAGRTMIPLIFRPGFLTNEYIRGRRVHYVPPLRLYFFVSIVFFLILGFFTDDSVKDLVKLQHDKTSSIIKVTDSIDLLRKKMAAQGYVLNRDDIDELNDLLKDKIGIQGDLHRNMKAVQQQLDEITLRELKPDYQLEPGDQISKAALTKSLEVMRQHEGESRDALKLALVENQLTGQQLKKQQTLDADKRWDDRKQQKLEKKKANLLLRLAGDPAAVPPQRSLELGLLSIGLDADEAKKASGGNQSWKDDKDSVDFNLGEGFEWLSEEQNQQLKKFAAKMETKATKAFEQDASPLIKQVLGVLPQMMFFLLPIFALLLKIVYLFSKRFYMEHLTVALHSHAFLFVVLLLLALLSTLGEFLAITEPAAAEVIEITALLLLLWTPLYLFIMQKKVYKQGFMMTTVKFAMVGVSYMVLLSLTTAGAFFWGLANL
ncbi:MAG: hypothetical protein ACI8WB_003071 [Phenylobacterium sp.]|jgi:hypothetical protein